MELFLWIVDFRMYQVIQAIHTYFSTYLLTFPSNRTTIHVVPKFCGRPICRSTVQNARSGFRRKQLFRLYPASQLLRLGFPGFSSESGLANIYLGFRFSFQSLLPTSSLPHPSVSPSPSPSQSPCGQGRRRRGRARRLRPASSSSSSPPPPLPLASRRAGHARTARSRREALPGRGATVPIPGHGVAQAAEPVAAGVAAPQWCLLPLLCVCSCATGNPSCPCWRSRAPSADPTPGGGALLPRGDARQRQQRRLRGRRGKLPALLSLALTFSILMKLTSRSIDLVCANMPPNWPREKSSGSLALFSTS